MTDSMTNPSEAMIEAVAAALWNVAPSKLAGTFRLWDEASPPQRQLFNDMACAAITAMQQAATPAAPFCTTCGASDPSENEYCSNGFHAEGQTYWPTPAAPVQDDDAERFFIDHGMIHDRVSGRHVTCEPTEDAFGAMDIDETCALLNSLARLTPDRVAPLVEALAYTLDDWQALSRIISKSIVENDGPDRVRWEGVWYDGPLATAYLKTLRAIGEMANRNIAALREGTSDA